MPAFRIDWKFGKLGMSESELALRFESAEERWAFVITGWPKTDAGKPAMKALKISVDMADLNPGKKGKGDRALGRTTIVERLPASAGEAAGIPTHARMLLDKTGFRTAVEERPQVIRDLIAHEIGHALGFGTMKPQSHLVKKQGGKKFFTGAHAMAEYAEIAAGGPVPLESSGNAKTAGKHWDEDENDKSPLGRIMVYELMSGNFQAGDNRLTRLTVAAMHDLGYRVNIDAAEHYRDED